MKKTFIIGLAIASFLLSSCSFLNIYSTDKKDIDVYEIDNLIDDDTKTLEKDGKNGTVTAKFIKGEKYIPYLSLDQYADLYKSYFAENVTSEVENSTTSSSWTVYKGGDLYFYAVVSPYTKSIMVAGALSNTYKSDSNPKDYSSLTHSAKFEDSFFRVGDKNYTEYSFRNYDFKTFKADGQIYLPLGLLNNVFSNETKVYYQYNYKNIYATWDVENYAKPFKTESGSISVDQEMESVTNGENIPSYLIDYNANLFIFVMENFYGLKSTFKIASIKDYYVNNGLYKSLFSTDNKKRGETYSRALAIFDDNHTGLVSVNNAWGEGETKKYGNNGVIKRQTLRKALIEKRDSVEHKFYLNKELGDFSAASDVEPGTAEIKTVMFSFDGFELGSSKNLFNEDGTTKVDAYKYDTFYYILENFKAIKNYGGIKNVIIDVALNGGGIVGCMAKILALISKDNRGSISLYDEPTGLVSTTTVSVDSNEDGKYDTEDCYGDDFNIYIMASDCSFSCGNALPLYAQEMGIKVLGEKSGGGECAVGIHYLPNSQYVYHSSTTHICHNNLTKAGPFTGFENGAEPNISLVKQGHTSFAEWDAQGENVVTNIPDDLYDINHLESLLGQ